MIVVSDMSKILWSIVYFVLFFTNFSTIRGLVPPPDAINR